MMEIQKNEAPHHHGYTKNYFYQHTVARNMSFLASKSSETFRGL